MTACIAEPVPSNAFIYPTYKKADLILIIKVTKYEKNTLAMHLFKVL